VNEKDPAENDEQGMESALQCHPAGRVGQLLSLSRACCPRRMRNIHNRISKMQYSFQDNSFLAISASVAGRSRPQDIDP
jgi:hypothetical protein